MKLDTITKIEQYLTDVLLSSPQIPLGVNVIRLAATTDEEGIATLARSIVVRYTGSSVSVKQRQPLAIERTMKFELIHSSQSYLSESGHDAAAQMCAGAYLSINNTIPMNTGVKIVVPFSMTSENFDGLTDSSHYVYTQQWEVVVIEVNPTLSVNPCVLYGNCSELFPLEMIGGIRPGDVVHGNRLYSPIIPPPFGVDFEEEYCGVVEKGNDLVYTHNPSLTFLQDWKNYKLVSTGQFVEDSGMLICNIKDENGDHIDTYYAGNCDNRGLIGITVYDSFMGQVTSTSLQSENGLCYTTAWPKTKVYADPHEEDTHVTYLKYGYVLRIEVNAEFEIGGVKYHKVNGGPFGVGYVDIRDVEIFYVRRYIPFDGCVDLEASNDGPPVCE